MEIRFFPGGMVLDHHRSQVCEFIYCHRNIGFKLSLFTGDNYKPPAFQLYPDDLRGEAQGFGLALRRKAICLRSRRGALAPLLICFGMKFHYPCHSILRYWL